MQKRVLMLKAEIPAQLFSLMSQTSRHRCCSVPGQVSVMRYSKCQPQKITCGSTPLTGGTPMRPQPSVMRPSSKKS